MARRHTGNMNGERYLANKSASKREVHDLDNEKTNCQIDEIIRAKNDVPYNSLSSAHTAGYDNCAYCLGGSTR
ncbi:hypothetical protein [Longimicrobium sp.]|uniref:hypothetical protein n=1 Tax=Longimicrobium sp. TaxID=2029185 RepID=UPI002E2EEF2F|nr:hypothetical protein [Longimicrobium sp.]HEX6038134.1 hypothetical protein [Longimicrobium sp.]